MRRRAEEKLHVPALLHNYQWEGVAFLYRSQSGLLADEMGLGKTVQTVVALALLMYTQKDVNRAIIVAPASLTTNWIDEFEKWTPSLTVRRVEGNAQNREAFYLLPIPVLVASYEQIRLDGLDRIPSNAFDIVILDEAQRVKNRTSTTSLACRLLPRKRAWALSATPLENNEADIESILGFLDPSVGQSIPRSVLNERLRLMMLRRKKSDVREELPPVILQDLRINLSLQQRNEYEDLWFRRTEAISHHTPPGNIVSVLLGLITRLKVICNFDKSTNTSSKWDALQDIFDQAGDSARILVFSQFVETLHWISERMQLPHSLLTGSMPLDERQKSINAFKSNSPPRVLLVSLRAGGVGLNLGEATHVVLFDRWWNPAVEVQAIFRAHRFERKEPLHVVRLLVVDTIEERIAEILDQKEQLFDDVIESVKTESQSFSRQEMMRILQLTGNDVLSTTEEKSL
ncbi:MAG: DEAD/DEAH box helicase [Candidatus Dadabacteria bacterium]|nr:DEAD/DEAH box helicase [Candidatus Dadabacteria bacterium]MYA47960.1 DEAD/DEAH box helicase [Candidatus Dadabacteria bacterium]MYF48368.1 DEAD/DEAH box helicase [Candidatus Dadabacteria bacterium]MYG82852.1 DEAD/DEAH box helicase [Candidatus Dadabacteria bacterium]MYK49170.1 DEAD/DEAH box helicase [Candidatus Dadabacteria bacterium]